LKIEKLLLAHLEKLEAGKDNTSIYHSLEDSTIEIRTSIPQGKPLEWIIWYLCNSIGAADYYTADCSCREHLQNCSILLKSRRKGNPDVKIYLKRSNRFFSSSAKMAIVVSDFGFKANATSVEFLSFPEPLTISIVSTKKMSTWTAQIANEYKKELIILLPMEPLNKSFRHYSKEALMVHFPSDKIHAILENARESIPYYAGFSNLCGSRILDDSQVMKTILTEFKKNHAYFLIDPVSHESTAASVARTLDVPYRTIEISLDSAASASPSIEDTIRHAAMIAHKTGSVVVQGKATKQFIFCLKEQLPYLQKNGIRLVYASEVMHHGEVRKKNK
jgi:polysaccharide deacetylase 2 family uncharacterized protein YibQ